MKKLKITIFLILIPFLLVGTIKAATKLFPYQGGTGSSTAPSENQILVGTSGGIYTPSDDLLVNNTAQFGNASTDYHGINTTPVAKQMLTADFSNTANGTNSFFIDGTMAETIGTIDFNHQARGYSMVLSTSGTIDVTDGGDYTYNTYASDFLNYPDHAYQTTSGTLVHNIYGLEATTTSAPLIAEGVNVTLNQYGINTAAQGNLGTFGDGINKYGIKAVAEGTAINSYAGWFSASNANNNYGIWVDAGDVVLDNDSQKLYFGEAQDVYMEFDSDSWNFSNLTTQNADFIFQGKDDAITKTTTWDLSENTWDFGDAFITTAGPGSMTNLYGVNYINKPKDKTQFLANLPLQQTWTDSGENVTGSYLGQPFIIEQDGTYYVFYEYVSGGKWYIGLTYTTDFPSGSWTVVEPLLSPSNNAGEPDDDQIADPTVLYIPWATNKWHMWFDMDDGTDDDGDIGWTIGHAYAASDPTAAINWTKQNTAGVTDIVIGQSEDFGGYDNTMTHAPEAFIHGGTVRILYACRGTGHSGYDEMLAIADDSFGLGYSFEKWGPVTNDSTIDAGGAEGRVQGILPYQGVLYSLIYTSEDDSYWISSVDGGKSWNEFGKAPFGGYHLGLHSFLMDNNIIWGIGHGTGAANSADIYYIDLENLSGTTVGSNVLSSSTNLALIDNTYLGYYIQGGNNLTTTSDVMYLQTQNTNDDIEIRTDNFDNAIFIDDSTGTIMFGGTTADSSVNQFKVFDTLPETPGEDINSIRFQVVSAGSESNEQRALKVSLLQGYTGSSRTTGIFCENLAAGTSVNVGQDGRALGTTIGENRGIYGVATNTNAAGKAYGVYGTYGATTAGEKAAGYFVAGSGEIVALVDGSYAGTFKGPTSATGGRIALENIAVSIITDTVIGRIDWKSNDASSSPNLIGVVGRIQLAGASNHVSAAQTYMSFHTNTGVAGSLAEALRITHLGNLIMPSDSTTFGFGANAVIVPDATIGFDGDSLNIIANIGTTTDALEFTAGSYEWKVPADTDIQHTFTGTTNSGVLTWMEDEGTFDIHSATSATNMTTRFFTKDGDGTDDNIIRLYGVGTQTDQTNSEFWQVAFAGDTNTFEFSSLATGTGTIRDFYLYTENYSQIKLIASDGSTRIGESSGSNYTQFASDGTLTLAGTARVVNHLRIPAHTFKKVVGGSPPEEKLEGIIATIDFDDSTDEQAYYTEVAPFRMDGTVDMGIEISWTFDANQADNTKKVKWSVEYIAIANGEAVNGATTTTTQLSAGNHNSGQGTEVHTVFATGLQGITVEDIIGIRVFRDADDGTDTFVGDARLMVLHIHFTSNKLGE